MGKGHDGSVGIEGEIGMGLQECIYLVLVLSVGDGARRVDQHAARTDRCGTGTARIAACTPAISPTPCGVTRQRRSARACNVPRPEQGGSTSTRSNGASWHARHGGVGQLDAHVGGVQTARGLLQLRRPAGLELDRHDLAPPLHERGQVGALAPRGRAEVEHALPRLRVERPRHEHRGARLREERPRAPQRRGVRVEGAVEHERLGQCRVAVRADRQFARESVRVGHERVDAQRHLARLVVGGHQRACLFGAELLPPQPCDPLGVASA